VTRRASPMGALIFAEPRRGARQVGIIPAWMEVVGAVVEGERIHGNPFWYEVRGFVWDGRTVEDTPLLSPAYVPSRCRACGQFIGTVAHQCPRAL
jgi:hypothetical protein